MRGGGNPSGYRRLTTGFIGVDNLGLSAAYIQTGGTVRTAALYVGDDAGGNAGSGSIYPIFVLPANRQVNR
jgi:hypothetical protein